jgi:hypothetical protein
VGEKIADRMTAVFKEDYRGRRPVFGEMEKFQSNPNWYDRLQFFEYFNGDTGAGLGASHQTGWTGLIAKLIQQAGEHRKVKETRSGKANR